RAGYEVDLRGEVVVLVEREPSDAVDVVRAVHDVLDRPERLAGIADPDLTADVEEVDEVVVERPGRIELRAVDRVRELEMVRVALRRGTGRHRGGASERKRENHQANESAHHDRLFPCRRAHT